MTDTTMLTTKQVAERLDVSTKRVWALIKAGRLPSQQFGRDHLINESDLALVSDRKPGRPPKPKDEGEPADGATGAPVAEEATATAEPVSKAEAPKVKAKAKAAKVKTTTKAGKSKRVVKAATK